MVKRKKGTNLIQLQYLPHDSILYSAPIESKVDKIPPKCPLCPHGKRKTYCKECGGIRLFNEIMYI